MAVPDDKEIRRFYRSALHRLKDAEYLLTGNRTTGTVYLAGYCVECLLKVLILSNTPLSKRAATVSEFKGAKAHDFIWLQTEYRKRQGAPLPSEIKEILIFMTTWSVHLRYSPVELKYSYASRFLKSARSFLIFVDGRL